MAGQDGYTTKGEQLIEAMRRSRRGGDARLNDHDRAILRRLTDGDLADEFAEALAGDLDGDELLAGPSDADE